VAGFSPINDHCFAIAASAVRAASSVMLNDARAWRQLNRKRECLIHEYSTSFGQFWIAGLSVRLKGLRVVSTVRCINGSASSRSSRLCLVNSFSGRGPIWLSPCQHGP